MKSKKIITTFAATVVAVGIMALSPLTASAHCDTMDGPVINDAKLALEENNINYISKWVFPEDEAEITEIFNEIMKVRDGSPEAKELADKYLFENLVRIHRENEGAPYTGIKPEGTSVEKEVAAADESIAVGSLEPFNGVVEEEKIAELEESFKKVLATKDFDVNDVEAGREYVESYVIFTHLAEGEHGHGEEEVHSSEAEHSEEEVHEAEKATHEIGEASAEIAVEVNEEKSSTNWLPWTLAGIFFVTNIIAHVKLFHLKKHTNGQCNH